jgi:hypothetical protein
MRNLRLCVCLVAAGTLFMVGGCKRQGVAHFPQVVPAVISNCSVSPDPIQVHPGDKIDWEASDGQDYTIEFVDHNEPTPNPFQVKHGGSNPPHPINGQRGCKPDPQPNHPNDVYCKYTVIGIATSSASTSCTNDPGVHIIVP